MLIELIQFLQNQLNEQSSFTEIREVAQQIITNMTTLTSEQKKEQVISALKELKRLENITIQKKKVLLAALEVVMLSRRVSDLRQKGVYGKKVEGNNNHSWTLEGAQLVISTFYPNLPVEYYQSNASEEKNKNLYIKLQQDKGLWVVFGYDQKFHLTLLRLELFEDNILQIYIFDSLGIIPMYHSGNGTNEYEKALMTFINALRNYLPNQDDWIMNACPIPRQKDGVNCFSFVLSDLDAAQKMLIQNKTTASCFIESTMLRKWKKLPKSTSRKYGYLVPEFHALSQFLKHLPEQQSIPKTLPLDSKVQEQGNPQALDKSIKALIKLAKKGQIIFSPNNYRMDCESEEDEQYTGCVIM